MTKIELVSYVLRPLKIRAIQPQSKEFFPKIEKKLFQYLLIIKDALEVFLIQKLKG